MTLPATILAADWAKDSGKRAVWAVDVGARTIHRRVPSRNGWTLRALLDTAVRSGPGPVLVAVDVALGVPAPYFQRRGGGPGGQPFSHFVEWLPHAARADRFFETGHDAQDWSITRPFFAVPAGDRGLRSFIEKAGFDLLREVDRRCGGKPVFVVAGIPGSVGAGSREFWRELAPMLEVPRTFRVWPFEGQLTPLLPEVPIVVAEMYPRIAYAIAVSPSVPARLETPRRKRDRSVREEWLARLRDASWIRRFEVKIADGELAASSEHDFDSLFTAAALLRCVVEGISLASGDVDRNAEGGILGTEAVMWKDRASGRTPRPRPSGSGDFVEERMRLVGEQDDLVEEFVDCAGETRAFRFRVYAEGRFLDATEIREGEPSGLRFVLPAGSDGFPPWGAMRIRIRDRLARKHIVRDKAGKLHILGDVVRAQIRDDGETGLPTVVVDDLVITWKELGELLLERSGFGIRLAISEPGEE